MVEQFFTALIWRYLGNDQLGMAVTGGLGNQSKADVLQALPNNTKDRKNYSSQSNLPAKHSILFVRTETF